jgi:hypothetical protein
MLARVRSRPHSIEDRRVDLMFEAAGLLRRLPTSRWLYRSTASSRHHP